MACYPYGNLVAAVVAKGKRVTLFRPGIMAVKQHTEACKMADELSGIHLYILVQAEWFIPRVGLESGQIGKVGEL